MAQYYYKKTCITCKIEKEIASFNIRKDSKDGYRNQCKVCITTQKNIDKIKNYEKYEAFRKERVSKNKNKLKINVENFHRKNPLYRKEYQKNGTTEEELFKLNHYSNIQQLCSYHNRIIKKKINNGRILR